MTSDRPLKLAAPETSVIHGTALFEDIIPALFGALEEYWPAAAAGARERWGHLLYLALNDPDALDSDDMRMDDSVACIDDLERLLSYCAPPHHYFGVHYGNSSDYGFWPLLAENED